MKKFCITIALFLIGCESQNVSRAVPLHSGATPTTVNQSTLGYKPTTFIVDNFHLWLSNIDDRCILNYRQTDGEPWKQIDMGLRAPCDFIGRKIKNNPPQRYIIGKGSARISILLVTGDPPHPKAKDEFMPGGCGTHLAKVRVYSDHIDVEPPFKGNKLSESEPDAYCPSDPLDDVFFATG